MKRIIGWLLIVIVVILFVVLGINYYVKWATKKYIVDEKIDDFDCILILGAGVWGDRPSPILEDRLKMGISLYKGKVAPKIIMSGDHGTKEYDEVNLMKKYALEEGVDSEDIFMDHAGFSTYDSIYRVKEIFEATKIVIVTQRYHLYRALYIARSLGIEAYGMPAEDIKYSGDLPRELREILARNKDFVKCIIKPEPRFLGETIPVNGDGNVTNDKDDKDEI